MRFITVLALSVSTAIAADPQDSLTQAHFMVGEVEASISGRPEIDFGYVHGFRSGHKFSLFRSDGLAWGPVGIVQTTRVYSHKSLVRVIRGQNPQKGDLVVVHQNSLGHLSGKSREDFYITRRILLRQYQNGYDTRTLSTDSRQLSRQLDNSRRWYRQKDRAGTKIHYGTRRDNYESQRIVNLAKQCQMLAEIQLESPGGLNSLSPRWKEALPIVTGYTPPKPKKSKEPDEEAAEPEDGFAEQIAPNVLPAVSDRFQNEPKALQEVIALILGSAIATPPPNTRYYIRSQFRRSQFPQIADEPERLEELDEVLSGLN